MGEIFKVFSGKTPQELEDTINDWYSKNPHACAMTICGYAVPLSIGSAMHVVAMQMAGYTREKDR